MLFSVTFNVGMRDAWMPWALREERFREKKATVPLYLLLLYIDAKKREDWVSYSRLTDGNLSRR